MTAIDETHHATVFWHRALPPLNAEPIGEHTLEATSSRVPGTLNHRDDLWDRCHQELMVNTELRLGQEIARLGGHYAHVYGEAIEPRRDQAASEAWLHGRFSYMLYRPALRPDDSDHRDEGGAPTESASQERPS